MNQKTDQTSGKRTWTKPALQKFALTDDERAQLTAAIDPMELLFKLRPELKAGDFA